MGIGKNRKKFLLKEVLTEENESQEEITIYSLEEGVIKNINNKVTWAEIIDKFKMNKDIKRSKYLAINFITPTRIKYQDEFISVPEFHIIIRSLMRRISNLSYFHCGETLNINFDYLINQATKIKIDKISINWVEWERFSFIQERRMKFGGFVGEVIYKGDLSKFLPFLILGEYIHVGKGASFGLGLYKIMPK
ncbi:MAG: CRISPR system precrRNA processing endoribonuclease RAMP protein Cas6 [Candidatus Aminicenantes bacterium]|nr:CRISPR system precrRNA processing endoribonuclease RAMP protein Cas6 [Candidatus Aminicenantes bacterium]